MRSSGWMRWKMRCAANLTLWTVLTLACRIGYAEGPSRAGAAQEARTAEVGAPGGEVGAPPCQTSPRDFWLCAGDTAWVSGYLIPPDVLDLRLVPIWEEKAALVPRLEADLEALRVQRGLFAEEVEALEGEVAVLRERDAGLQQALHEAQEEAQGTLPAWQIALWTGGGVLLGLLVGWGASTLTR